MLRAWNLQFGNFFPKSLLVFPCRISIGLVDVTIVEANIRNYPTSTMQN